MGVAHRNRSGQAVGRSGTIRARPDAVTAGVRAIHRGRGHSGPESGRTSVGDLRLTLTTKHSYGSSRPIMPAPLSYVARGDRSRRADTLRGSLYVICPRRGSGAYSAKLFAGTGGGATGLV